MWIVPERYECTSGTEQNSACEADKMVPCWVARPVEKTILIRGMLILALCSIFLSLCEIAYVTLKWGVAQRHRPIEERSKLAMKFTTHEYDSRFSSIKQM